jgi:putative spermidine/putrescine transport system substrate-binding protein
MALPGPRPDITPQTVVYGGTIYEYDLIYRTAAFPTAPASWQDLWKPGITVGVPYVGQSYGMTFLYIAALLNGGSATNLDPGFDAIKRLGKYKIYNNVGQGLTLFQQGEIDAALYYAHRGQQLITLGLPVGRTRPKEGVYAQRTGTQIPKGTSNMPGAIAWVAFSLSPGYQTPLVAEFYSPANKTVPIPPALAANFITGDAEVAALRDPPWAELLPQRDEVLDRWRREMG